MNHTENVRGKSSWWRRHFLDHPLRSMKHPSAYANPGAPTSDKFKVICRACYTSALNQAKRTDPHLNQSAFNDQLWSQSKADADCIWISSAKPTLINHLIHCKHGVLPEVKEQAITEKTKKDSAANRGEEAYEYMEAPMAGPSSSFGFNPTAAAPQYYPPPVQPEPTAHPMAPGLQRSFSLPVGFHGALPSPLIGSSAANLPHRWVENPEWATFVAKFIPGAKLFSRNKLTKTLILQELERVWGLAQKNLKDLKVAEGTFQLDGWTGGNYHHFLGFMFTAGSKVFAARLKDTSCKRKTAEKLLAHVRAEFARTEETWNIKLVALVSDNSGESLAMRKALQLERPDLIIMHAKFLEASAEADQVIRWLRSKTQVLAILRKVQEEQGVSSPLTVIRAVLTCWISHYLAYRCLLDLKNWITQVVSQDRGRVKAGQETANILQSTSSRLDHVALVFGTLFLRFTNLAEDKDANADEEEICRAVCDSLNKRWLDSDQDILVAAVILNPHTRAAPLKSFWHADIIMLLARIWKRLFSSDTVPPAFYNEVKEYISDTGTYADMPNLAASLRNPNDLDHSAAPLEVWKLFMTASGPVSPLQRLAERIFSVCPNVAPVERFFSLLKRIMTPSCSRLTGTNLMNSAELSLHIMQEYESGGALATRLQWRERHFIDCAAAPPPTITPTIRVPMASVPIAASVTPPLAAGSALSGAASVSGPSLVFQPGASSPGPITVLMTGQPDWLNRASLVRDAAQ
ncbi:uncharacterized protein PHACADRAFT_198783 [Phanerochaete carnosa HHB-10118-sp]|uniref:HAT C-terminal dimerisation domain-containing protein n=1 Tax=Phanerochaete carnosa (strain HHB-10118-sp) TaxID=650164 RepID=K5W1G1_PHACS|nr:uncharacterized protein PHACADRAFT_198783 [Phanerochaete carnosa HHB-10118-sp]EKM52734.1 hypothetical protein PHACADRAFT_198783 [Phanerochaete carnosa HHB-10118-sp]